ncbi:uncharacterized protein Z520_00173 [Fonsecaea multimorphosa CBS 102226]|uniref:Xylanolytic transcriptional activator regulatory domain-containing protein n=1 Tax=Fonsecaea multimorphosa CBS 102226 TaxID=1442371 RepID=A0A0D2J284_9EURO|nr:uncharacterized protein Z520_00173 [Fonsecaea multimorphosa CBS 102226]KIY03482.1 hypothetical protein Z520_00173 [Fonsecaea multimorphosa CBS 102226]
MLEESSIVDLSKQLLDRDSVRPVVESVDAIPGSHPCRINDSTTFRWRDELPYAVPSPEVLNMLSDSYFSSVNWFMMASLVLDESKFRALSTLALAGEYMETSDRNFCFLMSLVWGLGAHYLWTNDATSSSLPINAALRSEMMSVVDVAYSRIMADPSLEAVQIAILLGSFHLFHGLPYLGFAIFGSGVRCAQAMGLHRQSRSSTSETRLVWWALEICDKYAAVAFGLPCGIDDSDCDVPEINDSDIVTRPRPASHSDHSPSPLTYHKLKGRLYRIMGPFLGRKRQTNQLRGLLEVRRELTEWHTSVPDWLKCSGEDGPGFDDRPIQLQVQAIALQLAYDNLQMVLFRQAVFPKNVREDQGIRHYRADGIGQLSQSATRTASISTLAASRLICRSSHAAMHVAICSFTAGVILCLMIASQPNNPEKSTWLASLKKIINLFEDFPSQNYRLATQSLGVLKALDFRVDPQTARESAEDIGLGNQPLLQSATQIVNPLDNRTISEDGNNAASNPLELNFGDFDFASSAGGPLEDVGQLWLWEGDPPNEEWMSNFT